MNKIKIDIRTPEKNSRSKARSLKWRNYQDERWYGLSNYLCRLLLTTVKVLCLFY